MSRIMQHPWRWSIGSAGFAIVVGLVHGSCAGPRTEAALGRTETPPLVDEHVELARRHAPWIVHEVDATRGREDLPTRADFDGNLRGDDNWDSFARFELAPVVYYAAVQSETHWFLTYHLFHPRDWSRFDLGLHMTHENDGENLQIVVEKARGRAVLLLTQAHYCGVAWADPGSGFASGTEDLCGPLVLVDDSGRRTPDGGHPVVFVESGGHGILGWPDAPRGLELPAALEDAIVDSCLVLRPAARGEAVAEPELPARRAVAYALASTVESFWPGVRDGSLIGEGGLFDGSLPLRTPEIEVDVPRYYEGDRFSGPFGPDRGISPFAVDFGFGEGEVGALLFDPARRLAACLQVPESWSRRYVDYPFTARSR
jgi:hypothetical protein